MKKFAAAILIVIIALSGVALAERIGGDGWWDDGYSGTWVAIAGGDMVFKAPQGWRYDYDPYSGYETYTRPDECQYVVIRFLDRDFMDCMEEIEENASWGVYDETAWLILRDDRDWYMGASSNYIDAVCPGDLGGVVWITVVMDDTYNDWYLARRMISSVSSLSQY